jgi:hypothetical protein
MTDSWILTVYVYAVVSDRLIFGTFTYETGGLCFQASRKYFK